MDWDKLRVFKAVAEAGSFTNAGEELNLSQSAVSRQIGNLESSLGLPLFHRHARGLILTEQGDMLLQTTCDVFDRLQQVESQLTDSRALPEGPLTITTVEFIASTWLIPKIGKFKETYPDIQMTLLLDDRVYDLGRREADVGIRVQKVDHSDLIERKIKTIEFSLCASKQYLETKGRPKTHEELKDHLTIGFPQNSHPPFQKPNWIYRQLGIDVTGSSNMLLINSMDTRYAAVKNGVGISVLPNYIVNNDDDLETIFPEIKIPSVDMFFVYPQELRNSKRISVFRDFLIDHISKDQ